MADEYEQEAQVLAYELIRADFDTHAEMFEYLRRWLKRRDAGRPSLDAARMEVVEAAKRYAINSACVKCDWVDCQDCINLKQGRANNLYGALAKLRALENGRRVG